MTLDKVAPIRSITDESGKERLSNHVQYPEIYNIFVNDMLSQSYSSFLRERILPHFRFVPNGTIPEFLPLDGNNHMQLVDTTIFRSFPVQHER